MSASRIIENRQNCVIDLPITDRTQLEDLAHIGFQVIAGGGLSQDYAGFNAEPVVPVWSMTDHRNFIIDFLLCDNGAQGH